MAALLVVDDDPDIRSSLRVYLAAHLPVEVFEAADAQEALALARHRAIDVILTDFLMPGRNGLELLAAWHEIQPRTQGMLLTAYPDAGVAARAVRRLGAANVFAKPVDPWQLATAAARLLGVQIMPAWADEGVAA